MKTIKQLLFITVLNLFITNMGWGQQQCPDLDIVEVRVDTIVSADPSLIRFRFDVIVRNRGALVYDPGTAGPTYINLSFTAPGYTNRHMAQQNLQIPFAPNSWNQTMRFEVNVNRTSRTLPDWENMPLPTNYCGYVTTGTVPANYECRQNNNRKCYNDRDLRNYLR
jgi:hypothetical protein